MTPVPQGYSLRDLADRLSADLVPGNREPLDPDARITGVAGLESATADDLTFLSNPRYTPQARSTAAGAILVSRQTEPLGPPTLRVPDPYLSFAHAIDLFYQPPQFPPGRHPTAIIAPSAHVPADAHVGAYVVVMDGVILGTGAVLLPHTVLYPHVRAGDRLLLHAHAVLREHVVLGDDVTVQSGAIIGGDGFGFARSGAQGWHKITQAGTVRIGDRVEVQANACVDRASVGETSIGTGTKIDNLVQVGHGSVVGQNTLLCAQVGLAGSSHIGSEVILAGQVGVAGHCHVGDGAVATAQSGIPGDVAPGVTVSGYPAVENRRWLKTVAALNRLPDLVRNLK